jgi:hypothetical protein
VTRSQSDNWSTTRSLAFLAAVFALVIGTLLPSAVLAAAVPGQPIIICSAEGNRVIAVGMDGEHGGPKGLDGSKCAACLLVAAAALPEPPRIRALSRPAAHPADVFIPLIERPRPPARAPPRPPSTAPPQA